MAERSFPDLPKEVTGDPRCLEVGSVETSWLHQSGLKLDSLLEATFLKL